MRQIDFLIAFYATQNAFWVIYDADFKNWYNIDH